MSKEIKLSATRINTFLQCKQKYWFNYHEHLPKMSNPAFILGTVCHRALEFAGSIWMEKGGFDSDDIKKILEFYDSLSIQEGLDDLLVHNEGKRLVSNKLNEFEIGRKIIGLEDKFGFGNDSNIITSDGVMLIGALDKVVEIDDETLLIVDYKTSNTAPTKDQLRNDIQLSIYDVVAGLKWPEYKRVILCLDLLKSGLMFTYRSLEERKEFTKYLKVVHNEMCSLTSRDVKPNINIFCAWCDFRDYCKAYKKVYEKGNYTFELIERLSDDKLVEEWKRIRNSKKLLEGREKELSSLLIEKIKRSGTNLVVNGDEELYIKQNKRTSYDVDAIRNLVPANDFAKMVYVKNREVERYIEKNCSIKNKVKEASRAYFTSPYIMVKKGKNL